MTICVRQLDPDTHCSRRALTLDGFGSTLRSTDTLFPDTTFSFFCVSISPAEVSLMGKICCASLGAPAGMSIQTSTGHFSQAYLQ